MCSTSRARTSWRSNAISSMLSTTRPATCEGPSTPGIRLSRRGSSSRAPWRRPGPQRRACPTERGQRLGRHWRTRSRSMRSGMRPACHARRRGSSPQTMKPSEQLPRHWIEVSARFGRRMPGTAPTAAALGCAGCVPVTTDARPTILCDGWPTVCALCRSSRAFRRVSTASSSGLRGRVPTRRDGRTPSGRRRPGVLRGLRDRIRSESGRPGIDARCRLPGRHRAP